MKTICKGRVQNQTIAMFLICSEPHQIIKIQPIYPIKAYKILLKNHDLKFDKNVVNMIKFLEIQVINPIPRRWSLSVTRRSHFLMIDTETISETSHFISEFTRIIILSLLEASSILLLLA